MDTVFIKGLKINAIVGIFEQEREVAQEVVVDLEMANDISVAAKSKNIADALDYATVAHRVESFIIDSRFLLLETLAEECARIVMAEFAVPWLRFRCAKTQALSAVEAVGVCIERGQKPNG